MTQDEVADAFFAGWTLAQLDIVTDYGRARAYQLWSAPGKPANEKEGRMTQEEKARAFDEIMEDARSLDDKPHRLFLTLRRYAPDDELKDILHVCYRNAGRLRGRP